MTVNTAEVLQLLLGNIAAVKEVQSIGISGSKAALPNAGEGDIDVFIYCDSIPGLETRQAILDQMGDLIKDIKTNVFEGGHWGIGDTLHINGVETWLMYFSVKDTLNDVESILKGDYPDKVDNYYYPVGRLAMLRDINILYDRSGFLPSLKNRLSNYPDKLAEILIRYHLEELEDLEDLERAVSRKDVLFYHFASDIAIDHFLQALFAINKTFFPSRKRTLKFISSFNIKPPGCEEQLLEVVRLGACTDTINQSYELWCSMIYKLKNLNNLI